MNDSEYLTMNNLMHRSERQGKFRSERNTPSVDAETKRKKRRKAAKRARMNNYKSKSKRWM